MPAALEVNVRKEGQIGILETDGYINDTEADRVAQAGHALIDEGFRYLVTLRSPVSSAVSVYRC